MRQAPLPLCYLGRKFQHTNGQNLGEDFFVGPKTGLNLNEDLFFFWSSPNFGQENGLILSREIFLLIFIILKFPAPPLSKILRKLLRESIILKLTFRMHENANFLCNFAKSFRGMPLDHPKTFVPSALTINLICDVTVRRNFVSPPRKLSAYATAFVTILQVVTLTFQLSNLYLAGKFNWY